jgi:hypothetical protein
MKVLLRLTPELPGQATRGESEDHPRINVTLHPVRKEATLRRIDSVLDFILRREAES